MNLKIPANPSPHVERPELRRDIRESVPASVRAHLAAEGAAVAGGVQRANAWLALRRVAARPRRLIVDAYQHAGGAWVVEIHGYPWQECRYSPTGWQTMYTRYLATWVEQAYMPLAAVWEATYQRIAGERPNGMMLPPGEQWAESVPAQGGGE